MKKGLSLFLVEILENLKAQMKRIKIMEINKLNKIKI
jgi:hypothetical protein